MRMIRSQEYHAIIIELKGRLDEWFNSYVDPQFDGVHEAVTGKGQLYWAGLAGRGTPAFAPIEEI